MKPNTNILLLGMNIVIVTALLLLAFVATPTNGLFMPEERAPQKAVFMALASNKEVWGPVLFDVQASLAEVANTLAKYQPVVLYVSPTDEESVKSKLTFHPNVILHSFQVDDLWMRDTSCIFAYDCANHSHCVSKFGDASHGGWPNAPVKCVDFNFNGWGNKQKQHLNDKLIAANVAKITGAAPVKSKLVMEGGSIEVDGEGTALCTRSSIINTNRNDASWGEKEVEEELYDTLGVEKVIWTDGIKGKDITDAHIDFYARFVSPGVVVASREDDETIYDYAVTRKVIADLEAARDARGRKLKVHVIPNPSTLRPDWSTDTFAASYINYYVGNGVVAVAEFGDATADSFAKQKLQELYPTHVIEMLNTDPIAFGGGGIHCSTQQQPLSSNANEINQTNLTAVVAGGCGSGVSMLFAVAAALAVTLLI